MDVASLYLQSNTQREREREPSLHKRLLLWHWVLQHTRVLNQILQHESILETADGHEQQVDGITIGDSGALGLRTILTTAIDADDPLIRQKGVELLALVAIQSPVFASKSIAVLRRACLNDRAIRNQSLACLFDIAVVNPQLASQREFLSFLQMFLQHDDPPTLIIAIKGVCQLLLHTPMIDLESLPFEELLDALLGLYVQSDNEWDKRVGVIKSTANNGHRHTSNQVKNDMIQMLGAFFERFCKRDGNQSVLANTCVFIAMMEVNQSQATRLIASQVKAYNLKLSFLGSMIDVLTWPLISESVVANTEQQGCVLTAEQVYKLLQRK
jgi:hypothetical protein